MSDKFNSTPKDPGEDPPCFNHAKHDEINNHSCCDHLINNQTMIDNKVDTQDIMKE